MFCFVLFCIAFVVVPVACMGLFFCRPVIRFSALSFFCVCSPVIVSVVGLPALRGCFFRVCALSVFFVRFVCCRCLFLWVGGCLAWWMCLILSVGIPHFFVSLNDPCSVRGCFRIFVMPCFLAVLSTSLRVFVFVFFVFCFFLFLFLSYMADW